MGISTLGAPARAGSTAPPTSDDCEKVFLLLDDTIRLQSRISTDFGDLALAEVTSTQARVIEAESPKPLTRRKLELIVIHDVYPSYSYTKNLVEAAAPLMSDASSVLVMGTGSGYEAVALAKIFPKIRIDAVDISSRAVANTELNADFHSIRERVRVWQSDLFSQVNRKYDFILFLAPRPISLSDSVSVGNSRLKDSSYFDLGGSIVSRFLAEGPRALNPRGHLILFTDEHTSVLSFLTKTILFRAPWISGKPEEGQYVILDLTKSQR